MPILVGLLSFHTVTAATPTVEQALKLEPVQSDVEYDVPTDEDAKKSEIAKKKTDDFMAWVVRGPNGDLLRQFVDSNGDGKLDQWRYFRNGIEVYRDIDRNFNGKADEYRWLGTAGTRWGLDENEDGRIDQWKVISPEEVSAEVVQAVRQGDPRRFENVLLSPEELQSLGLGKTWTDKLGKRIQSAKSQFDQAKKSSSQVSATTEWIDFGALRPGTIPAGTRGVTKDVTVYENVVAMVETDGKPAQIPIGTLIQVGNGWRVTDLPLAAGANSTTQFVFFEAGPQASHDTPSGDLNGQTQKLVEALQQIDDQLANAASPSVLEKLNRQRADALEKLAQSATTQEDREMWWRQFADTVGAAAQTGAYPQGTERLLQLRGELQKNSKNKDLIAHVAFAHMSADYAERLQAENADFTAVQTQWLKRLESFVKEYPTSQDAPEAMLQLALAKEFAGNDDEANQWYTKIVKDFRSSPLAKKASGAKRRLESEGKTFALKATTVQGKPFDLARLRGNVVVVHYWATWCEPCKQDMLVLKKLQQEYDRKKLAVVGINLDSQADEVTEFFRKDRPAGTHLYEQGGLDSRLANEMGVFTLPVMFLVDQRGRVVRRQIHAGELKTEIDKLLR